MMCVEGSIARALQPKPFRPVPGEIYRLRSGGEYRCMGFDGNEPILTNMESGWTMTVHGLKRYPSGLIEWDYSTGGHWEPEVYTWMP